MSICSASASFLPPTVGLTWKPKIMASDAEARFTSASDMAPTPL